MPKNTGFRMEDDNPLPDSPIPLPVKKEGDKIPPLEKLPDAVAEKLEALKDRAHREMPEGGAAVPLQKLKSEMPRSEIPMPANANTLSETLGSVVDTLKSVIDPLKSFPGSLLPDSLKPPEIPMLFMKDGTNVSPNIKVAANQYTTKPKTPQI